MKAYTLGLTKSYDLILVQQEKPMKLGACSSEDLIERFGVCEPEYAVTGYPGGWVWQTFEEAESFRKEYLIKFFSTPDSFSVYEIDLPDTWDKCTKPGENCAHIQMDVLIVKKVKKVLDNAN